MHWWQSNATLAQAGVNRPRGPMDKASAHGAGDCRFESYRGQHCELDGSTQEAGHYRQFSQVGNILIDHEVVPDPAAIPADIHLQRALRCAPVVATRVIPVDVPQIPFCSHSQELRAQ